MLPCPDLRTPQLAAIVLLGATLALAGCGRNGPPELPDADTTQKPAVTSNQLIPGLDLPQKSPTTDVKAKPKGKFVLDPLL